MRLIRLVSKPPTSDQLIVKSEFENYFNDNIILKSGSKIGLLSASIPINTREIYVNSSNNQFEFKTAKNQVNFRTVDLGNDALYTVEEFIDVMRTSIWQQLTFDNNADIGCMLDVRLYDSKFYIELIKQQCEVMNLDQDHTINLNVQSDGQRVTRQDQGIADNTTYIYSKVPMIPSCGYIRARVVNVNNLIIGITSDEYDPTSGALLDGDFQCAIKIEGGQYFILNTDGNYEAIDAATATPAIDDVISLEFDQGTMIYNIYPNNNAPNTGIGVYIIATQSLGNFHFALGLRNGNVQTYIPEVIYDPRI